MSSPPPVGYATRLRARSPVPVDPKDADLLSFLHDLHVDEFVDLGLNLPSTQRVFDASWIPLWITGSVTIVKQYLLFLISTFKKATWAFVFYPTSEWRPYSPSSPCSLCPVEATVSSALADCLSSAQEPTCFAHYERALNADSVLIGTPDSFYGPHRCRSPIDCCEYDYDSFTSLVPVMQFPDCRANLRVSFAKAL